jgi:putative transposase
MGQSLVKNYLHITFSTKYRQPFIIEKIETEVHSYLGGICNEMECTPVKIGGCDDHVHILCMLSKKVTLAKLLEQVKSNSSKWMKTLAPGLENFYWQNGYGAFSVNPAEIAAVIKYISNQRRHHKTINFQEEFLAFLKKYQVVYDERYLWD